MKQGLHPKVKTVVFVTGKFYYDILAERENLGRKEVALVRIEQLFPLPVEQLKEIIASYPNADDYVWAQEEPKNMGAYQFVFFRFMELLNQLNLKLSFSYVGRSERSSPATGSIYRHRAEQQQIVADVFRV